MTKNIKKYKIIYEIIKINTKIIELCLKFWINMPIDNHWANQKFLKDIKVKIQENLKFKLINFFKLLSNDRNTATFTLQKPSKPVKKE